MKILELGTGLLPAYTGKILADLEGNTVTKITEGNDPILSSASGEGEAMWKELNDRKKILEQPLYQLAPVRTSDVVFDTFPLEKWEQLKIDPARLALQWNCAWISMPLYTSPPLCASSALYLAFQVLALREKRGQRLIIDRHQVVEMYHPRVFDLIEGYQEMMEMWAGV